MDLTPEQWQLVQPLLPPPSKFLRGRPPIDDRLVLDAILWKISTGEPWYDLPPWYPSFQTCYRRYHNWKRDGVLGAVLQALYDDLRDRGGLDLEKAFRGDTLVSQGAHFDVEPDPDPDLEEPWQISTARIFIGLALHKQVNR
jgi:transposase